MFSQAPNDDTSLEERLLAGLLVRQQLEQAGLQEVADKFNQPSLEARPSVTVPRRRARPFTEMEAAVVSNEDADYENDLLALTRTLQGDTAQRAQDNSDLYKLLMQYK